MQEFKLPVCGYIIDLVSHYLCINIEVYSIFQCEITNVKTMVCVEMTEEHMYLLGSNTRLKHR